MNGSQAIAEMLKLDGVEQVFCFPFTPILEALAEAGIRPIVARQERVAENVQVKSFCFRQFVNA
jgi:thiamine pyrophosphate-dependent acetolactate synthase large subunit-like protein